MLKVEYLTGDVKDVTAFIRNRLGIDPGAGRVRKATYGWTKEWEMRRERLAIELLAKDDAAVKKEMSELLAISRGNLKKKALQLSRELDPSANAIESIHRMARLENNLPGTINRTFIGTLADEERAVDNLMEDEGDSEAEAS